MKKVLYVATVDLHIRTFHLPYLKMLHDMGYEVHVATNGTEKFPYCDVKHTICIERNPFKLNNLKAIKQLKKIINEEHYDLIHCHTPMGSVVTRIAAKKARKNGTRVIYTAHGFHFYKGAPILNWLLYYPVEKYLSKYTDNLITINKEDYELAKNKFKKTSVKYISGIGVDTEKFNVQMSKEEKNKLRQELGLKKSDFVMIYLARLDKNKNQKLLIEVVEKLCKNYDKFHLILAGKDELNGYYQKLIAEKGLENNIHILGLRSDVPQLLGISNIAVASSLREGFGLNLVEALYSELPVIATHNRGHNEIINHGINGYLVNNNEIETFVNYILNLYNDQKLYNKMAEACKESTDKFNLNRIMKIMKGIYKGNEK